MDIGGSESATPWAVRWTALRGIDPERSGIVLERAVDPPNVCGVMTSFHLIALLAAVCIGLSKSGFSGISMVSVLLLADLYGAKASVGLALPLLIAADLMAYPAFIKHGSWRPVWRLLGPTLAGLALGWWMLGWIDDAVARRVIGGCVLLMVGLQVSRHWCKEAFDRWVETKGFGLGAGVLGGFATMLANAAGPVIQLYLMARKVPKMELVGIGARFFLLINLIKFFLLTNCFSEPLNARLPLITQESLLVDARLLPGVVMGVFGGRWLIQHVPQVAFEWMIVVFSAIAGLRLLIW